uniref:Putative salivary lipocalin n=1 Tax=Panstrongylus megistus TaxID=65343 RepID=A0A069DX67_9HEMI
MKTILAVICFGIVTFAFADYVKLTACNHPKAMENFNLDSFMTGTWYVTNAKHGSNSTVCREYRSKTRADNNKQVLIGDGYYTFGSNAAYFTLRCKYQSNENGKFIFNCTQRMPNNEQMVFNFPLEVTILFADYGKSAIMYRCVKLPRELGGHFEDNLLVLHREATNTDDEDTSIKSILDSQGLSLKTLKSRKGVNCPPPPEGKKF